MLGSKCLVLLLTVFLSSVTSVPLSNFYSYGLNVGDSILSNYLDVPTPEISLKVPVKFFDETYNSIYVNDFGCLTFRAALPQFIGAPFPLDYPTIAALYSNVDTRGGGTIYYRESQDPVLLRRADEEIFKSFPRLTNQFKSTSVFISTWFEVGYYKERADKVNTFQTVVITNGEESFVEFLYADNGIQWLQGTPEESSGLPDARAQSGLMQDGIVYTMPHSGTDQAQNLNKISNTDTPGVWIFRVGNLENLGKVEAPELRVSNDISCSAASTDCHSKADCIDESSGHCCICKSGYFGNGINCLPEAIRLRVYGKLSIDVNGVQANNIGIQAFVVTSDGRSYTAITKVPPTIGHSLQLSGFLANSIGWLYSKSINTPNGYQISGGVFNYSADLAFSTGQRISIQEQFFGHDVFDQLKMEGSIKGNSPIINTDIKPQLADYQQEFTHSSTGLFQSQSSHTYRLEGNNPAEITVRIIQNIQYTEGCASQAKNITNTRMKSAQNWVVYEARENILRIASTNKISTLSDEDPCRGFQCVANSSCIIEEDRPTCICNNGFQQLYSDDFGCYDINECTEGRNRCHQNAICINEIGSHSCQCRPGFSGNGQQCTEVAVTTPSSISPCESDPQACNPPHSTCSDPLNYRSCACDPGYQKDYLDNQRFAFICTDIDECLNYPPICHNNADCYNLEGTYECRCRPGYIGDGIACDPEEGQIDQEATTCDRVRCQENAECFEDPTSGAYCKCIEGFISKGAACVSYDKMTCDIAQDCSENAQCTFNEAAVYYVCECLEGYEGDGYSCELSKSGENKTTIQKTCVFNHCFCPDGYDEKDNICVKQDHTSIDVDTNPINGVPCNTITSCHPNAQCVYMSHAQQYLCQCNAGYEGDGSECSRIEVSSCFEVDICHHHASCKYESGVDGQSICVCDPGYTGDGTLCHPIVAPNTIPCTQRDDPSERVKEDGTVERYFESTTSTQCGRNAYCAENIDTRSFECLCHDGFYRDGDICRSDRPEDTQEPECESLCHPNAQCVNTDESNESKIQARCKCNIGYTGDGVYECNEESLGCNVVRNCHTNADCQYNATSGGYRCQCTQGYVGNGIECHPLKTCIDDKSLCSKDASCVIGTQGHFHCECNEGFTGNGFQCKPVHKKESDFLLVNQGMTMIRVPYQPSRTDPARPIHIQPNQMLIGIAIDCVEGHVYWSAAGKSSIKRSYYDGKNIEDVVLDNVKTPEGLAVDWINRAIYWTDSGLRTISVANLDVQQQPKVIISKDLVNPRGIAVHPYYRKVFWSDWNRQSPKIEWSNLDGTEREIFLKSSDLKLPNSLAIDFTSDELCWVDADIKSVECMNIRNRERRKVHSNCTYPFGLTITDDRYYWTEWKTDRIESVNKDGTKAQSTTLFGSNYLYGIVAVPNKCPGT